MPPVGSDSFWIHSQLHFVLFPFAHVTDSLVCSMEKERRIKLEFLVILAPSPLIFTSFCHNLYDMRGSS